MITPQTKAKPQIRAGAGLESKGEQLHLLDTPPGPVGPERDAAILDWIARLGVVSICQLRERFSLGRTVAYRRTAALAEAGLIARERVLATEPALLYATREGLRYAGLPFAVARLSPGSVAHWLACAEVWLALSRRGGEGRIVTERELRFAERSAGRALASAQVGHNPDESPRLHRPDLALFGAGRPVAVEVELSPKNPRRLEQIVRGWRRASCVERVDYLVAEGATRRGVERAMKATYAEGRVDVIPIKEVVR